MLLHVMNYSPSRRAFLNITIHQQKSNMMAVFGIGPLLPREEIGDYCRTIKVSTQKKTLHLNLCRDTFKSIFLLFSIKYVEIW